MSDLPSPGDELEADLPAFAPSTRNRLDPPQPSTVTTPEPDDDALEEERARQATAENDDDPFEPEGPKNRASSSRGSTNPDPVVVGAVAQLASLGVLFASIGLERMIGRGSTAFIASEEEAAAIAEPLGRIAARHVPIGDAAAGDVADGIEAGMAAANYGMRATADYARANTVEAPKPEDVP